jgi:hypothetical protein
VLHAKGTTAGSRRDRLRISLPAQLERDIAAVTFPVDEQRPTAVALIHGHIACATHFPLPSHITALF